MKALLFSMVVFVVTAAAADVSGTWKAATETPNGTLETTFQFKVDGGKLTGTASNQFTGESAIVDGKVDGDSISFTVNANFNGNEVKLNYKGTVAGDEMKITVEVAGRDRTFEMKAKRAS